MKVLEVKNIVRKDVPIYYRRLYSSVVLMELVNKQSEVDMDFQIEIKPTGSTEITITSMGTVDYPLVPLQKELKRIIGELESNNRLPA